MSISKWCIPYLSMLTMLTGTDNKEESTINSRIYQMRGLLRIGFIELTSNLFQAAIITSLLKSIQNITQSAYFLLEKKESISHLILKFNRNILIYAFALHAVALFDLATRYYRNIYFSEHAKAMPVLTEKATNDQTFSSKLAKNAVDSDRQQSSSTSPINAIKAYYLVFQGLIMGPIEIITYLCTLGPTLLIAIGILSYVAGYAKKCINARNQRLRQGLSDAGSKASQSIRHNHAKLTHKLTDLKAEKKGNDMLDDYFEIVIRHSFQIMVTLICAYFVFSGSYDLAMMSAQASAAPAALLRITKYLGLLKSHLDLDAYMDDRFNLEYLKLYAPQADSDKLEKIDRNLAINEVEAYKTLLALQELPFNHDSPLRSEAKDIIENSKCDLGLEPDNHMMVATRALQSICQEINNQNISDSEINRNVLNSLTDFNTNINQEERPAILTKALLNHFIKAQQAEKESFYMLYSKNVSNPSLSLYIALPIIFLGLLYAPLPTLSAIYTLPALSLSQYLSVGAISYVCLSALANILNIKPENVDATLLGICTKALIWATAFYFGYHLYTLASYSFLFSSIGTLGELLAITNEHLLYFADMIVISNARIMVALLAATYPALVALDTYCLQSLLFSVNFIATWISQELVGLLHAPSYVYQKAETFASSKLSGKSANVSSYLPSFQQLFAPHGESSLVQP